MSDHVLLLQFLRTNAVIPRPKYGYSPPTFTTTDETLLHQFNRLFRTVSADTPDLIRQAEAIRYQVYCVERQFENPVDHSEERERDNFDAHSVHSLLVQRSTGHAVGTVRLILPRPEAPEDSFSIQRATVPSVLAAAHVPIPTTAEVSRFSISKDLRRRKKDAAHGVEGVCVESTNGNDRRSGPLMSLGLIQALVRMSARHGITHWCAVMEPKLLRMLAAMAIHFEPIGGLVEYHGLRQPCYCDVEIVLDCVKRNRPMFWDILTDAGEIEERFLPNNISADYRHTIDWR
jgi:N-acyl amino acid synthase of PEP-CTERM/exosortase system